MCCFIENSYLCPLGSLVLPFSQGLACPAAACAAAVAAEPVRLEAAAVAVVKTADAVKVADDQVWSEEAFQ